MPADIVGNKNLRDLWGERLNICPDKVFLVYEDVDGIISEFTYGQFNDEINRTANVFIDLGIQKGDKVVLHLANSPEFLMCWFGLAKIGAVFVPSIIANKAGECEFVINFSDAVAVVTEPAYSEMFEEIIPSNCPKVKYIMLARNNGHREGWHLLEELKTGQPPVLKEYREIDSEDEMQIIFTSGTTARPKGVILTHCNALKSGVRVTSMTAMRPDDRMLTSMPAFHVNCQSISVMSTLSVGATLILLERYSATKFWSQMRRHRATLTSVVPMHVRTLLTQPPSPLDRDHCLRDLFFAINVTDQEKEAFESRFGVRFLNGYGLSETMTIVTVDPIYGLRKWPSIGKPAVDREIKIADDGGNEVPRGQIGEIVVKGTPGRTIMKGYYKDPEATKRTVDEEGWLHTGDNGYMDEEGWVYFFDRKKDVIKRGGENVSATEVEIVLTEHPKIAEAAVIGVRDPIRDEAVKAFVVLVEEESMTVEDVIVYCQQRLAKFKVPSFVEFRPFFPKTSIGKIEKKILKQEEAAKGNL